MLRDLDDQLDRLRLKLALAKGTRARGRIMAEIEENRRLAIALDAGL
jgi:hypothetical protein